MRRRARKSKFEFKFDPYRKYLPIVFIAVWPCGFIANVGKMFSYESVEDINLFLATTFHDIQQWPDAIFFDKACSHLRSLEKLVEEKVALSGKNCLGNCDNDIYMNI